MTNQLHDVSKKMKLSDLQPNLNLEDATEPTVDWSTVEETLYKDCPEQLHYSLMIIKILQLESASLQKDENIDMKFILECASKIAKDTTDMQNRLLAIQTEYAEIKRTLIMRDNIDQLTLSFNFMSSAQEWMDVYDDTVMQSINDLIEYIDLKTGTNITNKL